MTERISFYGDKAHHTCRVPGCGLNGEAHPKPETIGKENLRLMSGVACWDWIVQCPACRMEFFGGVGSNFSEA